MRARPFCAVAAALALTGSAGAQPGEPTGPVIDPDPTLIERLQPDLTVGVGWAGFTGGELRDVFESGPAWHVRAGVGEWNAVRFEVVYSGSMQDAVAMDASPHARLMGHGVHGQFRINVLPELPVDPFFFAGAGWSNYRVVNGTGGAAVRDTGRDNVLEVPIGVGAGYRVGSFYLDVRAAFSAISSAELVPMNDPDSSQTGASMHRFGLRAYVGWML